MLKVNSLSFAYTDKPLLDKVSFTIGENQKVGLVGPNGAGKTTLFNLITQKESIQDGKVEVIGNIAVVPQEVKYDETMEKAKTIRDYLNEGDKREDHEHRKMLTSLGLSNLDLSKSPKGLSGGQKTKLALARALVSEPDVLLLDEPTNFMDIEGKKWVMNFLSRYPKSLFLISHDIELMDKAIDKVLYINHQNQKVEEYKGNYTQFKRLKEEHDALEKRKIIVEQKHIKRMEESLVGLYAHRSEKGVRQRVQLEKRLEKLKEALPDLPREVRKIKVNLPTPLPVGELPIRALDITKSYEGKVVFKDLNFSIIRGEKIALIGPNGAGKSTLIKILVGMLKPDEGEVSRNYNLKIGYYSQEFETFDLEKTLLDTITQGSGMPDYQARPFLGRFNFMGNKVFQKVKSLSGGEKTRLSIALLTSNNYNLLILDEPTTYLDVMSQRIILDTLKAYKGTMIIVSHTQEFVEELKPVKAFLMPENKMVFWDNSLLDKIAET
ncbi:MAG TPA: ABC-F family ATP-binding cassette domain-containing protein [Patescibacteria group bacterium]